MSNLQDMQDKTVEVILAGETYQARQLFAVDWAQVEREIKSDGVTLNDIFSGEPTMIGYLAVVKIAIEKEIPKRASHIEIFDAAGAILDLDIPEEDTPEKNSQQVQEET